MRCDPGASRPPSRSPRTMGRDEKPWLRPSAFWPPWWSVVLIMVMATGAATQDRAEHGAVACAEQWQRFAVAVRDGTRPQADLARAVAAWPSRLAACFAPGDFDARVVFPVEGYGLADLGAPLAAGYRPQGYRFLDGNRHGGHPAVDIFVYDRDRDGRDDRSNAPIRILAPADGVVMGVDRGWHPDGAVGQRRGGNLTWIYHPALGLFSYMAHLDTVRVQPGQRVRAGEPVATLGRSGRNAHPARSPTHLHLMWLRAETMTPVDPLSVLSGHRPADAAPRP